MSEHSFSRPIRVADVPRAGQTLSVVASAEERADLARAFGLQEIKGLEAQLRLKPRDDGLTVQGRLEAQVVYTCVVTLEPVPGHIIEEIEARFAPEHVRVEPELDEIELSTESEDPPEPIRHGMADLGPLIAEFLALGLDPYPRAPGAGFVEPSPEAGRENPFAVLATLSPRKGQG